MTVEINLFHDQSSKKVSDRAGIKLTAPLICSQTRLPTALHGLVLSNMSRSQEMAAGNIYKQFGCNSGRKMSGSRSKLLETR